MTALQSSGQQLSYGTAMRTAFAGMLAFGSYMRDLIRSAVAAETIQYGQGVVLDTASGGARNPRAETAVLTFSGALITANVVALNVSVGGVLTAITPTTFATDDATTLAAIATKIAAVSGIASATAGTHNITVVATGAVDVRLTGISVTAGSTQATSSVAYTSSDTFLGVVVAKPNAVNGAGFKQYDELGYATRTMGIYVPVSENVSQGDTALLDLATATLGQFKKTAGSTMTTGAKFLTAGTSGGLAILELNLP